MKNNTMEIWFISPQNQLLERNVTFVSKTFGNQFCFPLKLCVHVDVFHSSLFAVFYTTLKVFQHKMSFAKQKQSFLFPLYLFNQKISYGSRKKKINNLILEVKPLIYLDRYLFTVFIFLFITSFIYLFFDLLIGYWCCHWTLTFCLVFLIFLSFVCIVCHCFSDF